MTFGTTKATDKNHISDALSLASKQSIGMLILQSKQPQLTSFTPHRRATDLYYNHSDPRHVVSK